MQDWNWSDLLYGLVPILYILSQFLGSKGEKKSEEEKAADQQHRQQQEAELAERRRRIQEEIRRRIAGETPAGDAARRTPEPASSEPVHPLAPARPVPTPLRTPPVHVPSQVAPSEAYESDIERRLAAQREELKRARSARAAARRQADAITAGAMAGDLSQGAGEISAQGAASKPGTKELRSDILQAVRSHRNLRTAVVLTEILGPPVASRAEIGERLF